MIIYRLYSCGPESPKNNSSFLGIYLEIDSESYLVNKEWRKLAMNKKK